VNDNTYAYIANFPRVMGAEEVEHMSINQDRYEIFYSSTLHRRIMATDRTPDMTLTSMPLFSVSIAFCSSFFANRDAGLFMWKRQCSGTSVDLRRRINRPPGHVVWHRAALHMSHLL